MVQKSSKWKFLVLIVLIGVLVFVLRGKKSETDRRVQGNEMPIAERSSFAPSKASQVIRIHPMASLDHMSLNEIADFRVNKVAEYSALNIFPSNYNPLKPPHSHIYQSITPGAEWIPAAPFYIANPYLLVILTCANHVTPLALSCQNAKVKYSHSVIEEIYEGDDAKRWFHQLYSYPDYPGIVRIWMTNAYDACLFYAAVDKSRSVNVDFNWNQSPSNIANSAYSQSGFFHVGRYGKNNLSPSDPNGRIKLLESDVSTCICVKLWLKKPRQIEQKEDFTYLIKIIP